MSKRTVLSGCAAAMVVAFSGGAALANNNARQTVQQARQKVVAIKQQTSRPATGKVTVGSPKQAVQQKPKRRGSRIGGFFRRIGRGVRSAGQGIRNSVRRPNNAQRPATPAAQQPNNARR